MQTANVNPHITVLGRHVEVTPPIREYAEKKVESLHLDYPRIIEAKVVLDVQKLLQVCEIHLFCANHIVIDASTSHEDLYAAIDETIRKIARRMRKYKTRMLKKQHPRNDSSIRYFDEKRFGAAVFEQTEEQEEATQDPEPFLIHREGYRMRTLLKEEAIMELEMSEKPFVLYRNQRSDVLQIVFKREDGDYTIIELGQNL